MSNESYFLIISLFALLKPIIGCLSIRGSAIKVAREGIVIAGVCLVICLEGTRYSQIKEANKVIKHSSILKAAFLASNAAMLAFIAASLLLIL